MKRVFANMKPKQVDNDKQLTKPSILSGSLDNQDNDNPQWKANKDKFKDDVIRIPKSDGSMMVIDRVGMTDKKLAKIMASNQNQEKKDIALTNYLFDRGLTSAPFLAEMFQFKGHLTKETRQFKSQMRFDFEMFVSTFTTFMADLSEELWEIVSPDIDMETVKTKLFKKKDRTVNDVKKAFWDEDPDLNSQQVALLTLALELNNHQEFLNNSVKKITENREREKGKGIYLDKLGRAHSLYDENLVDIIKAEKEDLKKKVDEKNNPKG